MLPLFLLVNPIWEIFGFVFVFALIIDRFRINYAQPVANSATATGP
jgi:hypothetical protein